MKKITATDSPSYRSFISERDRALERILWNQQRKQTDLLRQALLLAKDRLKLAIEAFRAGMSPEQITTIMRWEMDRAFEVILQPLVDVWKETRANAFALSAVGEAEALGRVLGEAKYSIDDYLVDAFSAKDSMAGGSIESRVQLYLYRLKNDILDKIWTSLLSVDPKESLDQILPRIIRAAFPTEKKSAKPPLKLARPMKEASAATIADFAIGFVSDSRWKKIVDEYLFDYELQNRSPDDTVDDDGDLVYKWEFERDLNEELVASVRAGEIEGGEQNGVKDFMWVAIVDDRTDECCLWRDGLTIDEIQDQLKGSHSDDRCQASVPPAHFNCRCRIVPVTAELTDKVSSKKALKDFDTWLES